jgi:hypothetical protein
MWLKRYGKGIAEVRKGKFSHLHQVIYFFFLNINVFREKYGELGELGTGYCEEGGGPGERS